MADYRIVRAEVWLSGRLVARYASAVRDGPVGAHINRGTPESAQQVSILERAIDRFGANVKLRWPESVWRAY